MLPPAAATFNYSLEVALRHLFQSLALPLLAFNRYFLRWIHR
jgi:hypothetical protein